MHRLGDAPRSGPAGVQAALPDDLGEPRDLGPQRDDLVRRLDLESPIARPTLPLNLARIRLLDGDLLGLAPGEMCVALEPPPVHLRPEAIEVRRLSNHQIVAILTLRRSRGEFFALHAPVATLAARETLSGERLPDGLDRNGHRDGIGGGQSESVEMNIEFVAMKDHALQREAKFGAQELDVEFDPRFDPIPNRRIAIRIRRA